MRILIDECLPDEIRDHIGALGHECETTRRAGFGAKKNGELLALVEGKWEVLLTSDKNIKYQQNRAGRTIHPSDSLKIQSYGSSSRLFASLC